MRLCIRCRESEATVQFIRESGGQETLNVWLCPECVRPFTIRQEASRRGEQPCAFCGKPAFNPLPGHAEIIHACCRCRSVFAELLLQMCEAQQPEVFKRSQGDVFFFNTSFDPAVEAWSAVASAEVVARLRSQRGNHQLS